MAGNVRTNIHSQHPTSLQVQARAHSKPSKQPPEARRATQATASRLANLRNLAQQHLLEIERMAAQEEFEENKRVEELEREGRRRERKSAKDMTPTLAEGDGGKSPVGWEGEGQDGGVNAGSVKKERLRTAQDVLDRLRWDPSFKTSDYRIGYLDRFGGVKEMDVAEWMRVREVTDEEFIPMHRIRWFKRLRAEGGEDHMLGTEEGAVVWHRDERIDKIFGSS